MVCQSLHRLQDTLLPPRSQSESYARSLLQILAESSPRVKRGIQRKSSRVSNERTKIDETRGEWNSVSGFGRKIFSTWLHRQFSNTDWADWLVCIRFLFSLVILNWTPTRRDASSYFRFAEITRHRAEERVLREAGCSRNREETYRTV